jgi:hypothetical protein
MHMLPPTPPPPQIWSLSNIFSAPTSPQRPRGERDDLAPPKPPAPPELATGPAGWLYFNLLVAQSQVFVPVYDVGEAAEWSRQLWSGPEGGQQVGWALQGRQAAWAQRACVLGQALLECPACRQAAHLTPQLLTCSLTRPPAASPLSEERF